MNLRLPVDLNRGEAPFRSRTRERGETPSHGRPARASRAPGENHPSKAVQSPQLGGGTRFKPEIR